MSVRFHSFPLADINDIPTSKSLRNLVDLRQSKTEIIKIFSFMSNIDVCVATQVSLSE